MCCIFTCCGWMVDLIQRLWTFTMSCIISSAVCCSLITASMSGVALGYNYSLAEYIDLKETNVSVYLKRGIFDDEIADDMEWRRRGHQPIAGQIGEDNLLTASDDSSTTLRSGRRLDDSIYESNDRNNFEGSLMRLTAKAPDHSIISTTNGVSLHEILREYPPGSVDVLKAVQGAINSNKAEMVARRMSKDKQEPLKSDVSPSSMLRPDISDPRRVMKFDVPPYETLSTPNSLQLAVPEDRINELSKWRILKPSPKSIPKNIYYTDSVLGYKYPSLATPRPGPARPTQSKPVQRTRPTPTRKSFTPSRTAELKLPKSIDEEMESFKEKLMDDKFDEPGANDDEFLRKIKTSLRKPSDDYDEQIKGLPLRKKRQINVLATSNKANRNKEIVQDGLIKDSTLNSKIVHLLKATSHRVLHKFSDASFTESSSNKLESDRNDKVYFKSRGIATSNKLFRLALSTVIV